MEINEKEFLRLVEILNNGECYDVGGQVVYGWHVGSYQNDSTSEVADVLIKLMEEIK